MIPSLLAMLSLRIMLPDKHSTKDYNKMFQVPSPW